MAPKKKGNKKGNDDWEADLGESVDPIAAATKDTEAQNADEGQDNQDDAEGGGGGGLLAALKKNKSRKQKKGKVVNEDYLDGEDPPTTVGVEGIGGANVIENLVAKAPEEVPAEEIFAAQVTKQKGGKGKQSKVEEAPKEDEDGSGDEGGMLKSKKEKEKEKKEKEKQRKKEMVILTSWQPNFSWTETNECVMDVLGRQEKGCDNSAAVESRAC